MSEHRNREIMCKNKRKMELSRTYKDQKEAGQWGYNDSMLILKIRGDSKDKS